MIARINDLGCGEYYVKIIRESFSSCCGYNFLVKYKDNTYFLNVENVIYPNNNNKDKYMYGKVLIDKNNNVSFYYIYNENTY